MSEELIQRLINASPCTTAPHACRNSIEIEEAADEIERLTARVKELEDVLDQRDGGAHDQDCRVFRQPPRPCNCGHELARTTLRADQ